MLYAFAAHPPPRSLHVSAFRAYPRKCSQPCKSNYHRSRPEHLSCPSSYTLSAASKCRLVSFIASIITSMFSLSQRLTRPKQFRTREPRRQPHSTQVSKEPPAQNKARRHAPSSLRVGRPKRPLPKTLCANVAYEGREYTTNEHRDAQDARHTQKPRRTLRR